MTQKSPTVSAEKTMTVIASFVIIVAGMRTAETLLVPFLLSAFIAIISAAPMFWLVNKGMHKSFALTSVISVIVGAIVLLASLVGSSVTGFTAKLPIYQERLKAETASLRQLLSEYGIELTSETLDQIFDPNRIIQMVANTLSGFGSILTDGLFILLTVIFMLLEASSFPSKLRHMMNNPDASLSGFEHFTDTVKRYMAIKTSVSLATGVFISSWLLMIGVDFPLLWGALAFLLNFVPNIGSIIAAIPAVIIAFVELGWGSALFAGSGYIIVNMLFGNIVEPRLMGRGLGLSTLVVFLSLVFWGWILGPVGMLLSVPLTMTVKIAFEHHPSTEWMAIMLGSEEEHTNV